MSSYNYEDTYKSKHILIDIDQREFFKSHIKESGVILGKNTHSKFDEHVVKEILLKYNDNLQLLMANDNGSISLAYFFRGDINVLGNVRKAVFVHMVDTLYSQGKLNDIPNIDTIYENLMKQTDINAAKFSEKHEVRIDDEYVKINTDIIINFIMGGYKNYNLNDPNWNIEGLNRDKFCFVVKDFLMRNMVVEKYRIGDENLHFVSDLVNDVVANTMQYNKHLSINDNFLFEFDLNPELETAILEGMPKNYSNIEKAIHVYIKLCKYLTYDPEFYANNQKGMTASIHEDINRLEKISPNERRIVCYEFVQLYAKFLYKMGISYAVDGPIDYGAGHSNLEFRAGDFVVEADSVTSILGGDLFKAKTNAELVGLVCKNKNKQAKEEYDKIYHKVYFNIIEQEQDKLTDEDEFELFLDMFDAMCEKEQVGIADKKRVFEKQLSKAELPTMEKLVYGLRLAKAIFKEEINNKQFDVTIISSKKIEGIQMKSLPLLIFSYNPRSFKNDQKDTTYMILNSENKLQEISRDEIISRFNCGYFKHISTGVKDRHLIPGIDLGGGRND